jgi:hypothetical protein
MMKSTKLIALCLALLCSAASLAQQQKGSYFNKSKLGILPGLKGTATNSFNSQGGTQLATVQGIYLTEQLALGLGIGTSSYTNPYISSFPIYLNADYYLFKKKSTPYLYGNLGYNFVHTDPLKGGVFSESGLGWRFKTGKKNGYMGPEIGYRYITYGYSLANNPGTAHDYLDALSLSFSFSF